MSEWIRFEDGRQKSASEYGTIMKDGRLVISNDLARSADMTPGDYVEVFYKPECKVIGLRKVPKRTPYAVKVSGSGPADHPFDQPLKTPSGKVRGYAMAIVPLRSLLNSRHIGLASKVKGSMYMDLDAGMLVFEFPNPPQVVSPSQHAAEQMQKGAFTERVTGDRG